MADSVKVATDEGATVTTTVMAAEATAAAPGGAAALRAATRVDRRAGRRRVDGERRRGRPMRDPIVFLHGNPTSSYMWRNVMPPCEGLGCRLIAPDLIPMGDSDRLEGRRGGGRGLSRPLRARRAVRVPRSAALRRGARVERDVTLVCHSWGATLGALWASRHAARSKRSR